MNDHQGTERRLVRLGIYSLLALGSLVFCWPLLWMIGTSMKADKELFTRSRAVLPLRPVPRQASPYIDPLHYAGLRGPRMKEMLQVLEAHLGRPEFQWPADVDSRQAAVQTARGIYSRFLNLLPESTWKLSPEEMAKEAQRMATPAMAAEILSQVRRGLLLGQLRARSYDLQEDQLVAADSADRAWNLSGSAEGSLAPTLQDRQKAAELRYDFSRGDKLSLSQTFTLSFPVERLYRIQLAMRGDESWHPLTAYLEKGGKRYKAAVVIPMADSNWTTLTWQEPGPDELTNKIRTWVVLKEIQAPGPVLNDPRKIKVTLELESVGAFKAWLYKMRRNYYLVFDNMPFWQYASTSVFLVVLNLIGTLASCSVVAYSFARLRWPGRNMSFALMLATMMVPAQVTMIPFFLIIRELGWYNTLYPLWACSFFASAFNVFLLHQFFKGVPTDLEDAARIDGCGPVRTYWYIMLPLVKPSLATIAIFTFMGVWNDFMGPLIYLSDQRLYPLSLGLYALNVQAGGSMSMMMAGSLLMILPVVLIFFFAQRYFIQGITMTGMKG